MNEQEIITKLQTLEQINNNLKIELDELKTKFINHLHSGTDGSLSLRGNINLPSTSSVRLGNSISIDAGKSPAPAMINVGGGSFAQTVGLPIGAVATSINIANQQDIYTAQQFGGIAVASPDTNSLTIAMGIDKYNAPIGKIASDYLQYGSQITLWRNYTTNSAFYGFMGPITSGTAGSVTSGGTTLTDSTKSWTTNQFQNGYVWATNGTTTQTFKIASNTSTALTITGGTWSFTSSSVTFFAYFPIVLGASFQPWDGLRLTYGASITGIGTATNGFVLTNPKNDTVGTLSGTGKTVEISLGGTPYYFNVYPTKT